MPPRTNLAVAPHPAAEKPPGRADLFARSLAAEILDGSRPVGSWLPSERELAEASGIGVALVRSALRRLETLGLVARGQGGALVTSGEVRAIYQVAVDAASGADYLGDTCVMVERRRPVRADAELAVSLDVREGSEWLHLIGLRLPGDPTYGPLSWVDAWLSAAAATVPDRLALTTATLETLLGSEIAEVQEEISAAPMTPAQSRLLRARGGEGSLHVMRRYVRGNGTLAAAVRDVHPAGRISVIMRGRRRAA